MPQQQLKVMISSTALDLPEHRKEIVVACLRENAFPLRMEDLPANSDEAGVASLQMVERADIYIGVFANRYGYVPKANNPERISVTEMEYNRAVERKIERLIFIMDKSHLITFDDVDIENAAKVKAFKDRVGAENIVRFFKSPVDLRAEAIHSLSKLRQPDRTVSHYVSHIPAPPEPFIAHPYILLQTPSLIGRQVELKLLTDWITGKELEADGRKAAGNSVRIMNIVAIGGLGKSALTWKWFNDIAPQEMKPLAGRMWWSFYESDATFENFVTRGLAYVTQRPLDEVQQIPAPERETELLAALNREPFLLLLDGLERILIAYARTDASRLDDSQVGQEMNLRKTADPRGGSFLKKLTRVENSRILVSSRLCPAELETDGGDPIPGSYKHDVSGLTDEDAVELWRALKVTGSRDELLPVFATFGTHPLLIQALAGEVKRYRRAPGNFPEWREANPQFDPSEFPKLQNARAHVLEFALGGLDEKAEKVLHTIGTFRMPSSYDTLAALLAGESRPFENERELDEVLTELEDRGLVGRDKQANRYALHPIVRSVVWSSLSDDSRRGLFTTAHAHFDRLPMIEDYRKADNLEDIRPVIEMYHALIGLSRLDDAAEMFIEHLAKIAFYRVTASREIVDLLQMLFPGQSELPRVSNVSTQAGILIALGSAYDFTGFGKSAAKQYKVSNSLCRLHHDSLHLTEGLELLALTLTRSGDLCRAEVSAREALLVARTQNYELFGARSLRQLGRVLASRGRVRDAKRLLHQAKQAFVQQKQRHWKGATLHYLARCEFWNGEFEKAKRLAKAARDLVERERCEPCSMATKRLEGLAALALSDVETAEQCLLSVLKSAHDASLPRQEIETLAALAELRRSQRDFKGARGFLDGVWGPAERGPYPLINADASNVLAQIERDAGNTAAAVESATKAYRLAWCDGPPFAYHWGLEKAKTHLKELGAPEPDMPPFDESKFEPMPEVEIDPDGEFHVGNTAAV